MVIRIVPLAGGEAAQANRKGAAGRPAALPGKTGGHVRLPQSFSRVPGLVPGLADSLAVLVPSHETAFDEITPGGLPRQLRQSALFPIRRWLRHEPAGRRQIVQNFVLPPNDVTE